ncbi:MAG: hypothetical protein RBJ76_10015 [Stenomitos frigidus ULC029]
MPALKPIDPLPGRLKLLDGQYLMPRQGRQINAVWVSVEARYCVISGMVQSLLALMPSPPASEVMF